MELECKYELCRRAVQALDAERTPRRALRDDFFSQFAPHLGQFTRRRILKEALHSPQTIAVPGHVFNVCHSVRLEDSAIGVVARSDRHTYGAPGPASPLFTKEALNFGKRWSHHHRAGVRDCLLFEIPTPSFVLERNTFTNRRVFGLFLDRPFREIEQDDSAPISLLVEAATVEVVLNQTALREAHAAFGRALVPRILCDLCGGGVDGELCMNCGMTFDVGSSHKLNFSMTPSALRVLSELPGGSALSLIDLGIAQKKEWARLKRRMKRLRVIEGSGS